MGGGSKYYELLTLRGGGGGSKHYGLITLRGWGGWGGPSFFEGEREGGGSFAAPLATRKT